MTEKSKLRLQNLISYLSFMQSDNFELSSGRSSKFYFDMKPTMLEPQGAKLIASFVLEYMNSVSCRYIGGLAIGAIPIVSQVVMKSFGILGFYVLDEKKSHGTKQQIYGHLPNTVTKDQVVLCDDVTTTGSSVLKAAKELRKLGIKIHSAITIIDRLEGAKENLAQEGIELVSLFTEENFIK